MGALLEPRSIGEPEDKADKGPDHRPEHAHDKPVRPHDERTFLLVAPMEASMPSERCRRCASTVKPPIAIEAR